MGNLNGTAKQCEKLALFAYPMLDDPEFLLPFWTKLQGLEKEGKLPDLKKTMNYKVYTIRGSQVGAHKSVVLSSDEKIFFTVELSFNVAFDGKRRVYPATDTLPENITDKLEYHGMLHTSGADLFTKAVAAIKKFDTYFMFSNNCQNYCNMVLKMYGLNDAIAWPDQEKAVGLAALAAVLLTVLIAILTKK